MVNSWADVDSALKRMAEIDLLVDEAEKFRKQAEMEARDRLKAASAGVVAERDALELEIGMFVKQHRSELQGKSKELYPGRVGFRTSPGKVSFRKGWTLDRAITAIRAVPAVAAKYLREKVELNKEAVRAAGEAELIPYGLKVSQSEAFFAERFTNKVGVPGH